MIGLLLIFLYSVAMAGMFGLILILAEAVFNWSYKHIPWFSEKVDKMIEQGCDEYVA